MKKLICILLLPLLLISAQGLSGEKKLKASSKVKKVPSIEKSEQIVFELPELPAEIWNAIANYLKIYDILSLLRASKSMYRSLINSPALKSAARVTINIIDIKAGNAKHFILVEGGQLYERVKNSRLDKKSFRGRAISQMCLEAIEKPLGDKKVIAIETGLYSIAALTWDGEVFVWGRENHLGGEGAPIESETIRTPFLLQGKLAGKTVVSIRKGNHHSMALTAEGEVYVWGDARPGALGIEEPENKVMRLQGPWKNEKVDAIVAQQNHSLALISDGSIYGWGDNTRNCVGLGQAAIIKKPTNLKGDLKNQHIIALRKGPEYYLALDKEGRIYAWGQLPIGSVNVPRKIEMGPGREKVTDIRIEEHQNCAITADRKTYFFKNFIETTKSNRFGFKKKVLAPMPIWSPK